MFEMLYRGRVLGRKKKWVTGDFATPAKAEIKRKEVLAEIEREQAERQAEEMAEMDDYDAHTCDYNWAGECQICGAIKYGSSLHRELYGGE